MTHLDTVPLCAGAKPVRRGKTIVPEGKTALGGDNRTGVGTLVTMLGTLLQQQAPARPADCAVHRARGKRTMGSAIRR